MNNSNVFSAIQKRRVSIVVPVYNNRETVGDTCSRILEYINSRFPHLGVEIVFVDDGSKDGSWDELNRIRDINPEQVSLLKLSRNFGQVCAILAGYEAATGDAIITISADLQDPVPVMGDMLLSWESGQEIVIAHRESRNDDMAATLFSKIAYGFARRANPSIPSGGFDYLLLSRRAADLLCSFNGRHRFFQGDVLWLGLPTSFIPYERQRRLHGKSTWTFKKKFKYFTDLILDSSYFPIRLMSSFGFITASAGLIYSFVIIESWLRDQTPFQGWAALMITILIVGGLIMMMLGVIGEYLWRIYDDIKRRPLFVIEKKLSVPAFSSCSNGVPTSPGN